MADWNPSLYLKFGAERTRPAAELLARIAHHPAALAIDLGCGPGNSTALLRDAWPEATIIGVDNSPAMLEEAARTYCIPISVMERNDETAPNRMLESFMLNTPSLNVLTGAVDYSSIVTSDTTTACASRAADSSETAVMT